MAGRYRRGGGGRGGGTSKTKRGSCLAPRGGFLYRQLITDNMDVGPGKGLREGGGEGGGERTAHQKEHAAESAMVHKVLDRATRANTTSPSHPQLKLALRVLQGAPSSSTHKGAAPTTASDMPPAMITYMRSFGSSAALIPEALANPVDRRVAGKCWVRGCYGTKHSRCQDCPKTPHSSVIQLWTR